MSIRPLLHPSERSRLALALVAAAVAVVSLVVLLVLANGAAVLFEALLAAGVFVATLWFGQQLFRARLLGQSIKVDAASMPELQAVIDSVKGTLQYGRRIDVYVVDKGRSAITLTSYLGSRVILLEGSLVAELRDDSERAQLTFLIGRAIGALKAKHARLDVIVLLLEAINALRYISFFLTPWYRATVYSGDQIGMTCCADLDAALKATRRLLVGKELAADLPVGRVLPQASLVQRQVLPRLVQLLSSEPHMTNRYANLICFGRYHMPELWDSLRSGMDAEELRCLDAIWQRSAYRKRVASYARQI